MTELVYQGAGRVMSFRRFATSGKMFIENEKKGKKGQQNSKDDGGLI